MQRHFFQSIGKTNFTTPKHLLLPVPIDDIDANPNLLPNKSGVLKSGLVFPQREKVLSEKLV